MKSNWVGNTALQELVQRPDRKARVIVEALDPVREDVVRTFGEWNEGSGAGIKVLGGDTVIPELPGIKLIEDSEVTHAAWGTGTGNVVTDLDKADPLFMLEIEWTDADAPDFEIHKLTARLDPQVDDNKSQEVDQFRAQLFRKRAQLEAEDAIELQQIGPFATADVSGTGVAEFTFELGASDAPQRPGGPPELEGEGDQETRTKTYVWIWAVDADGNTVGNVAWVGDSGTTGPVDEDGNSPANAQVRLVKMEQRDTAGGVNSGGQFDILQTEAGIPRFKLAGFKYTEATYTFGGAADIDLGAAPDAGTKLEVQAVGEEPGAGDDGSKITYELARRARWMEVGR